MKIIEFVLNLKRYYGSPFTFCIGGLLKLILNLRNIKFEFKTPNLV